MGQTIIQQRIEADVNNFRLILLPGRLVCSNIKTEKIYDEVYIHWKNFWSHEYEKVGKKGVISAEDFFRQSVILAILDPNGHVAASHFYCIFNLRRPITQDLHYFEFYNQEYIDVLKALKIETIMSLEFLTVDSKWRKKIMGFSLAEVLIGIGMRVMKELKIDAGIAPARKDVGAHEMVYRWGWTCIQKDQTTRNILCDMVAAFPHKIHDHPDTHINEVVSYFWNTRSDPASLLANIGQETSRFLSDYKKETTHVTI